MGRGGIWGGGCCEGSRALHIDPLLGLGGFQDGIADVLGAEGVAEVGVALFGGGVVEGLEELGELVRERVFVAEAEAGDPPVSGIRMIAVGGVDVGPAATVAGDGVIEVREVVEVVKVPGEGLLRAVDLEGVERLVAASVAGRFEDRERAVFKAGDEGAGVVDGDGLLFTGGGVDALLDEGLGHGTNRNDVAVDPAGGVDAVGEEVAGDTGAGCCGIETPEAGAALWELFGNRPVLEEIGAIVEDAAEFTSIDDVLGERDGGEEAVVVPDEVRQARGFDGLDHFLTLRAVEGERLFAEDHLAVLDALEGDLGMGVVGRADVDGVDVVAFHQLAPVGFVGRVAPLLGEGGDFFLIATADGLADRDVLGVEEVAELRVGVRVGAAHEAVTDESDADFFFHKWRVADCEGGRRRFRKTFRLSVFPSKCKGKV